MPLGRCAIRCGDSPGSCRVVVKSSVWIITLISWWYIYVYLCKKVYKHKSVCKYETLAMRSVRLEKGKTEKSEIRSRAQIRACSRLEAFGNWKIELLGFQELGPVARGTTDIRKIGPYLYRAWAFWGFVSAPVLYDEMRRSDEMMIQGPVSGSLEVDVGEC